MDGSGTRDFDVRMRRAAMAAAALPFVVAVIWLIVRQWSIRSFGDDAIIELRTREAFSTPILVGQVSRLNTRSLGPLWNYLAWPLYWLFGGRSVGMFIAAAVLNGTACVLTVGLAWRRHGAVAGAAFLVMILSLTASLGPHVFADHWNPHPVVFAMPLLFVLAWSVAKGNDNDLIWLAAVVSYALQIHLSGVVSSAVLIAAMVVARLVDLPRRLPSAHSLKWSAFVVLIAWLPPIVETMMKPPGNLARVAKFLVLSHDHQSSLADGVRIAVRTLSIPPSWIAGAPSVHQPAGWPRTVTALVALLAIAAVAAKAFRGRRRDLAFPMTAVVLILLAIVLSIWRTIGELVDYTVLWTVPASMLIWFGLVWCAVEVLAPRVTSVASKPSNRRLALNAGAGLSIVALCWSTLGAVKAPLMSADSRRIAKMSAAIVQQTSKDRPIVFRLSSSTEVEKELGLSVIVDVIKRGRTVRTNDLEKWFEDRDRPARPGDTVIVVSFVDSPDNSSPDAQGTLIYSDGTALISLVAAS